MLLSQDTLRREILYAQENTRHPTMDLLQLVANFGWNHGYETVIAEGIFGAQKNGTKLMELTKIADIAHVYYFDIPFDETVRRHETKPNSYEFGRSEMLEWWKEDDYLGASREVSITQELSPEKIVNRILADVEASNLQRIESENSVQ